MKIIIDIDDEMVCNDIKNKALEPTSETDKVIINALYNGTPVTTDGDLISREALKEKVNAFYDKLFVCCVSSDLIAYAKGVDGIIDNAPTVAVNCKSCDGYEAGYSAGLKDAERPQGEYETACNVLLSLEQIVRRSDGWEDSAVEAVHNAIQTAIKALEIVDDVNHKVYRNENCPQKHKCYDYQGYHCAGCSWEKKGGAK